MTKPRALVSFCVLILVGLLAFAAGNIQLEKGEKEVSSADAEALAESLALEIRSSAPSAQISGAARSGAGRAHSMSFAVEVPAADFPPQQIQAAMDAAVKRWGMLESFSTRGGPGISLRTPPNATACRSSLHFGSNRSHAFIDAVAYPFADMTRNEILVRTLEGA